MSKIGAWKMWVNAANAKPSPAIGKKLGPLGINMMVFCKEFNARTSKVRSDVVMTVTLYAYTDRTYKFAISAPTSMSFLRKAARVAVCQPGGEFKPKIGCVTYKELFHIAKAKSMDWQNVGIPTYCYMKSLMGTARSMGLAVERELPPEFARRDETPVESLDETRETTMAQVKAKRRAEMSGALR